MNVSLFGSILRALAPRLRASVLLAAFIAGPSWTVLAAQDSAVILQYHRFGESDLPTTNVTLEQFEAHLDVLQTGGFNVLPVPEILTAIAAGQSLPDKTVGITIDDATLSVFTEAWPRLSALGYPFTIFVATDSVDQKHARTMSWDQIRTLANAGVAIGNHTAAHGHMWRDGLEANRAELERSQNRLRAELGFTPKLFAYPYGEFSLELRDLVEGMGFEAAFGQQSGAIGPGVDLFALPRFPFNENYGDKARFQLVANSVPFPAADITPADPLLGANPPLFGFTLTEPLRGLSQLTCYASHEGRAQTEVLGDTRVEVRLSKPFPRGRNRINCTMPGAERRWHWLGVQFLVR